jgi:hypothetical protein
MIKQFKELQIGQNFTHNGKEYTRIENQRVSCCTTYNACETADAAKKIAITPLTEVQVNDQL